MANKKDKASGASVEPKNDEAPKMETSATAIVASGTVSQGFGEGKDKLTIDLPRKTAGGMVMSDKQALIIDHHDARQFANNMNAGAKSRAEKLKAATTEEDKAKYQPWTAAQYLTKWAEYEGADVGRLRTSSIDKMRQQAAWDCYKVVAEEHNKLQPNGFHPMFGEKAKGHILSLVAKEKENIVPRLLQAPRWQAAIDARFAELEAAAEKEKPKAQAAQASSAVDFISLD